MKQYFIKPALLAFLCLFSSISHGFEYFVVNRTADVFSTPDGNQVMTQLNEGSVLLEIDKKGEWSRVFFLTPEKQPFKGWILSKNITVQQQATPTVTDDAGEYYITAVNALRVRSGPGVEHPVVAGLKRGQMVKLLHRQGDWVKVKYTNEAGNTLQAWTVIRFLKLANASSTDRSSESHVMSKAVEGQTTEGVYQIKGRFVNFRSGPGTKYRVVGQLSTPQKVQVVLSQNGWKKINMEMDGTVVSGWVLEQFVERY